jgi:hypothetical protein
MTHNRYFTSKEEFYEIDMLNKSLDGKVILMTDTNKNDSAFYLAHVLRSFALRTYCVDETYKMINEPEGFRVIEDGRVILIKGNLRTEKDKIYKLIDKINPGEKIDLEIIIGGTQNEHCSKRRI